jgi:Tol biopolymer transport system component
VAVLIAGATRSDIWVYDVARGGGRTRLTFTTNNGDPVWTPDGRRIAFYSARNGPNNLYWVPADGSGPDEPLITSERHQDPHSWSPDGKVLAFYERREQSSDRDLWLLPIDGDRKPVPFLVTPFNERSPTFSPNGRWLAYASDESGRDEVYARAYPGPGAKIAISTNGGTEPVWSRDGQTVFYRNGEQFMAVSVRRDGEGLTVGTPRVLFEQRLTIQPNPGTGSQNYDVSPDGQRFLIAVPGETSSELYVVLNWFEELKRLVGN